MYLIKKIKEQIIMEKKVTINKLQFIASLAAASYMLGKTDEAALVEENTDE